MRSSEIERTWWQRMTASLVCPASPAGIGTSLRKPPLLPFRRIVGGEFRIDTSQFGLELRIARRSTSKPLIARVVDCAIQFNDRLFHQGILRCSQVVDFYKALDRGDSGRREVVGSFPFDAQIADRLPTDLVPGASAGPTMWPVPVEMLRRGTRS